MKDLKNIVESFDELVRHGQTGVLVTLVVVSGSAYRRPGARMLVADDGTVTGSVNGGCLEQDMVSTALSMLAQGNRTMLVEYDTTSDDEILFGTGTGCPGRVGLFFQTVPSDATSDPIPFFRRCIDAEEDQFAATVLCASGCTAGGGATRCGCDRASESDAMQTRLHLVSPRLTYRCGDIVSLEKETFARLQARYLREVDEVPGITNLHFSTAKQGKCEVVNGSSNNPSYGPSALASMNAQPRLADKSPVVSKHFAHWQNVLPDHIGHQHVLPDHFADEPNGSSQVQVQNQCFCIDDCFVEWLVPRTRLLIFGAGRDAEPLAELGRLLGWRITVVDWRSYVHPRRFHEEVELICCPFEELLEWVKVTASTVSVVMSHTYLQDEAALSFLLRSSAGYIGVLGPARRTASLLARISQSHDDLGAAAFRRVRAPVGVDIGSEGPSEIAVSVIAEIIAVLSGRNGGFLKDRQSPIHSLDTSIDFVRSQG